MAQVYVETSFFSACVTDRTDPGSMYRRRESQAWWAAERKRHNLFISIEVIRELSAPRYRRRAEALSLTAALALLAITDDVFDLAHILVGEKVMPAPTEGDALHVATATVHEMDHILSWNVQHLANPNKLRHLQTICDRMKLKAPTIVTPPALWESRNDTE